MNLVELNVHRTGSGDPGSCSFLTIQTWGGIGDILRELSSIPHERLYRWTGRPIRVIHVPARTLTLHPAANPPDAAFVRAIIERCPSLVWAGEGHWTKGQKWANRLVGRILTSWGGPLFPMHLPLTATEAAQVAACRPTRRGPLIGIQTHLSGLPSKRIPVAVWTRVFRRLLEEHPAASILLLEPDAAGLALCIDARVHPCGHLSVAQACDLIAGMDLLVSVDSWSKVAAAWKCVPQIILVPDQTVDYPELTAEAVWRHSFRGLTGRAEIQIEGLRAEGGRIRYERGRSIVQLAERLPSAVGELLKTDRR